jgi:hypothetical protein
MKHKNYKYFAVGSYLIRTYADLDAIDPRAHRILATEARMIARRQLCNEAGRVGHDGDWEHYDHYKDDVIAIDVWTDTRKLRKPMEGFYK